MSALRTRIIALAATAAVVAGSAVTALVAWPASPPPGPAADFETPPDGAPWLPEVVSDAAQYPAAWGSMNEALRAKDRETFLSYAEGDAREQLALWWDNTTKIGWATAYILPATGPDGEEAALLGAGLGFEQRPVRGGGNADAGYRLTHGFGYDITTSGDGEDMRITSIEPQAPMPWDEGEIHVARREHVVLYGMADERDVVEANVDVAEEAARLALATITDVGGETPMVGFVSGITDDAERMHRWEYGDGGAEWEMEVAGYAQPALRPPARSDFLEDDIATGDETSAVLMMLGPLSADQRLETFLHEFAHGLHFAAAPLPSHAQPPTAVFEGFAVYAEVASGVAPREMFGYPEVTDAIAREGIATFSDENLRDEDAWIGYVAAGSYFAFLADTWGDPWQLAIDGIDASEPDLVGIVGDERFSEAAWQAWIATR
ncbi:hypothetical protein [Microbacterium istanbulense]|uniref:Uncharacterized protein n=1 Tax=Microbacterium istanbulense TaxID=3122049 RepID=A0ABU8LNK2_9MICO